MRRNFSGKYKKRKDYRDRTERLSGEICPICDKPLNAVVTAIIHRETGKKAHFDCILKELKKFYPLTPEEEIYYIGGGSFGIIQTANSAKGFIIKRRIKYEEK